MSSDSEDMDEAGEERQAYTYQSCFDEFGVGTVVPVGEHCSDLYPIVGPIVTETEPMPVA
jgi:hypothetical protein